jgi:hypothetical protein
MSGRVVVLTEEELHDLRDAHELWGIECGIETDGSMIQSKLHAALEQAEGVTEEWQTGDGKVRADVTGVDPASRRELLATWEGTLERRFCTEWERVSWAALGMSEEGT